MKLQFEVNQQYQLDGMNFPWKWKRVRAKLILKKATHEGRLICGADKLHNLQCMISAFETFGEQAHKRFNAPKDKKLWFYSECVKIIASDKRFPKI